MADNLEQVAERLDARVGELYQQGRYREAAEAAREVVDLTRRLEAWPSANVAASLSNLALLQKELGDVGSAVKCYQQALDIYAALGERQPDAATVLNNLAALRQQQGRYIEAESLYRQAIEIYS